MIAVCDMGPLQYLVLIGCDHILPRIFDRVITARVVIEKEMSDPRTPEPVNFDRSPGVGCVESSMTHLRFQASQDREFRPIHGNASQKRHGASSRTRRTLRLPDRPISSAVGRRLSEPASGILGAHGPLVEPLFEQAAKSIPGQNGTAS